MDRKMEARHVEFRGVSLMVLSLKAKRPFAHAFMTALGPAKCSGCCDNSTLV